MCVFTHSNKKKGKQNSSQWVDNVDANFPELHVNQ